MADYLTTDTELTSIANAIRTKGGTSESLTYPAGYVSAIEAIPTGGGGVQTAHIEFNDGVDGWYTDGNMTVQATEYDIDYDTGTVSTKFDAAIGTLVFTSVVPPSVPSALTLVYSISRNPCRLYKVTG